MAHYKKKIAAAAAAVALVVSAGAMTVGTTDDGAGNSLKRKPSIVKLGNSL